MRKPAILGGKPIFQQKLPIVRPTLEEPITYWNDFMKIVETGKLTAGEYVEKLESKVCEYVNVNHAVAVSSCTCGLMLTLKALGLPKGSEVIVPSFTFPATVHALTWNGLNPQFADCSMGTFNIDVSEVERRINSNTSAIIAVYIFGVPPDIQNLEYLAWKYKLPLIFDSAQAFGAVYNSRRAGGFGDVEVFSLSPSKVVTGCEGGMVTTNRTELYEKIKLGRNYGITDGYDSIFPGMNARMSELHAMMALKNMKKVDENVRYRLKLIHQYKRRLKFHRGIIFQKFMDNTRPSGNYMVVFIHKDKFGIDRDQVYQSLADENIETKKYFYPPVHWQKAYKEYYLKHKFDLPKTEKITLQGLALPLSTEMSENDVDKVCDALESIAFWCKEIGEKEACRQYRKIA